MIDNGLASGLGTISVVAAANAPPTITVQPVATSTSIGGSASFNISFTPGNPVPTTVQWQYATAAAPTVFNNLSDGPLNGATFSGSATSTLTIAGATATFAGDLFRAVLNNTANLSATSTSALLSVGTAPTITQNPPPYAVLSVGSSQETVFTVGFTNGSPATTSVVWQKSYDGVSNWIDYPPPGNINGNVSPWIIFASVPPATNGVYIRAAVSNGGPFTVYSTPVELIVISQAITSAYFAAYRAYNDAYDAYIFGVGSSTTLYYAQHAYSWAQQAYLYDMQGQQLLAQSAAGNAYNWSYYTAIDAYSDYAAHQKNHYNSYDLAAYTDSTASYSLTYQVAGGNL